MTPSTCRRSPGEQGEPHRRGTDSVLEKAESVVNEKTSLDMTTLRVGIASYEAMKARTMAIAKGELKPKPDAPKIWLTSPERFAKLLSNRNRALLAQIAATRPTSLQELAASTGRTPGNLSRTLKTMERYGLVQLHKGERGRLRPEVPYREVRLEMSLT